MQWDHAVDIVSVGPDAGALATAIVALDGGQTVFVAQSASLRVGPRCRFGIDVSDGDTNAYLDAVTEVAGPAIPGAQVRGLPVRLVADALPPSLGCSRRRGTVEPFVGARLGSWAADCLSASHGVLYSHVTARNMATVCSSSGEKFEVAVLGAVEPGAAQPGWSIEDWLSEQADARGIDVHRGAALTRLVFDDGRVVGAVIQTPDGMCAVSARRGVVVATGGSATVVDPIPDDKLVRVGIVSKTASRFGRLELLARDPAGSMLATRTVKQTARTGRPRSRRLNSRTTCHSTSPGQLHDGSL